MYNIYKVDESDTLNSIARMFNTSVSELMRMNGLLNNEQVFPGAYLLVPMNMGFNSNYEDYNIYTVKAGDTIYSISELFGLPYETVLKINGLNKDDYIYPNQQILIPKQNSNIYITNGTETIKSIYEKYMNNWNDFLNMNEQIFITSDQVINNI